MKPELIELLFVKKIWWAGIHDGFSNLHLRNCLVEALIKYIDFYFILNGLGVNCLLKVPVILVDGAIVSEALSSIGKPHAEETVAFFADHVTVCGRTHPYFFSGEFINSSSCNWNISLWNQAVLFKLFNIISRNTRASDIYPSAWNGDFVLV